MERFNVIYHLFMGRKSKREKEREEKNELWHCLHMLLFDLTTTTFLSINSLSISYLFRSSPTTTPNFYQFNEKKKHIFIRTAFGTKPAFPNWFEKYVDHKLCAFYPLLYVIQLQIEYKNENGLTRLYNVNCRTSCELDWGRVRVRIEKQNECSPV